MTLELDDRQRAMLQEMGVRVWLPDAVRLPAVVPGAAVAAPVLRVTSGPATMPVPVPIAPATTIRAAPAAVPTAPGKSLALQDLAWSALADAAAACQACSLCAGRKHSTLHPPNAAVQADWLVVGDPPDEDEDRLGQPFVEQSGLLLDNMLKAVAASRSGQGRAGAYLSNVVKCRPPVGRLPQAADLAQCAQYLQREIELVQPKVILAVGRFATQLLLEEHPADAALPLDKQRGRVYRFRGVPVVVSYHPTVLLRASPNKAKAWADLCLAMDVLDGSLQ
jgi:uracil-DNA glycosylase family 4